MKFEFSAGLSEKINKWQGQRQLMQTFMWVMGNYTMEPRADKRICLYTPRIKTNRTVCNGIVSGSVHRWVNATNVCRLHFMDMFKMISHLLVFPIQTKFEQLFMFGSYTRIWNSSLLSHTKHEVTYPWTYATYTISCSVVQWIVFYLYLEQPLKLNNSSSSAVSSY